MKHLLPFHALEHPRDVVRNFTPNWFTLNMGTGITFLMLLQFPLALPQRDRIVHALYFFDLSFFTLFSMLLIARMVFHPRAFLQLMKHPVAPMFLGAIPMGMVPLINAMHMMFNSTPEWQVAAWCVDVALCLIIGWAVPVAMFVAQEHSLANMTGVWLLPVVPAEVAASSAGLLAQHLPSTLGYPMVVASYALWGMSMLTALGILAVLFFRLAVHKLPPKELGVSTWLALGPLGTGGFALLTLGAAAPRALTGSGLAVLGVVAGPISTIGALIVWGFGLWWLGAAVATTLVQVARGLPFNLGWWGFTFPLGVFIASTYALGANTGIAAFTWFAAVLTVWLVAIWSVIVVRSLHGLWHGHLLR